MTYNHVYDTNEQSRHPKYLYRASLVVQWLRVCFAMQGHRFDPWSGSSHMLWDSEAREPQRLSPSPTAHASQLEKPLQREAHTSQLESSPCSLQLGEAHVQQQRPGAANNNLIIKIFLIIKKNKESVLCDMIL